MQRTDLALKRVPFCTYLKVYLIHFLLFYALVQIFMLHQIIIAQLPNIIVARSEEHTAELQSH